MGKIFILMARKVLHVPLFEHILFLPFAMRQVDFVMNDKAEIHTDKPS